MQVFPDQRTPDIICQESGQQDTGTIGGKIHPVAAACFGTVGLKDLDASAHQSRTDDGSCAQMPPVDGAMAEKLYHPQEG